MPRHECPGGHFAGGTTMPTTPEIKTTANAVSRARLLMTVSHQASVPTVASVNAGKDSQTAAIDTLQGHVRHLTEQMSSL